MGLVLKLSSFKTYEDTLRDAFRLGLGGNRLGLGLDGMRLGLGLDGVFKFLGFKA